MEVPAFNGSEQARVAEGLFDAYRTGDAEAVRQFVATHGIFLELDNQVRAMTVVLTHMLNMPGGTAKSKVWKGVCVCMLTLKGYLARSQIRCIACCGLQIVRLAKRLPQGDVKLLAAALGTHQLSVGDVGDEEDLT